MMCEQTASYALMTHLCSILSNTSENITPLSFWSTREGSHISQECDDGRPHRLIGFFPRRPKLTSVNSSQILVKINESLTETLDHAAEVNVPMIIGVPLATSILDYRLNSPCSWYRPRQVEDWKRDHIIWLDQSGLIIWPPATELPVDGPLDDQAVIDLAVLENPLRSWGEAIAAMRHIRQRRAGRPISYFGMGPYRPNFLVF